MVNLPKFLKPYCDAGAFNSLLAPHRFLDDHVFLTKSNQLGVVLSAEGIDYECLTEATLAIETNFILCTEFKRVLNDRAVTPVRAESLPLVPVGSRYPVHPQHGS